MLSTLAGTFEPCGAINDLEVPRTHSPSFFFDAPYWQLFDLTYRMDTVKVQYLLACAPPVYDFHETQFIGMHSAEYDLLLLRDVELHLTPCSLPQPAGKKPLSSSHDKASRVGKEMKLLKLIQHSIAEELIDHCLRFQQPISSAVVG